MQGPAGAPTLLLLHGWMGTAALNWHGAMTHLGRQFRAVAPNLRGHGRGGRAAPPFSLEGCADDLAGLIEALDINGAIVVGYSMGGAVAQVLARRHRELLGGLVLCATAASFATRLSLRPATAVAGRVLAGTARAWPHLAAEVLAWQLARHDREAAERRRPREVSPHDGWALDERYESDIAAFIEAGAALNAYDATSWLAGLDIPTAVVTTARDTVVAPWRQEAMASLIPGAKRCAVEAGHNAVLAKPELFLPVLARTCSALARA